MKRVPLIKSVMTPFPYSIDVDDTVDKASEMMVEHDIHHLPVTKKGTPVGVISERDIKRALDQDFMRVGKKQGHRVKHIANLDAFIVDLTVPLDSVVLEMARKHTGTALVVRQGRLVGIFTASDACNYLGKMLNSIFPRGSDDAA